MRQSLQITKSQLGLVISAFMAAYALGQFVNGRLGDKVKPANLVFCGLAASGATVCLAPYLANSLAKWICVWSLNGYLQSMGWGPCVKLARSKASSAGRAGGFLTIAYISGSAISLPVIGLAGKISYPAGMFLLPGLWCVATALIWKLAIKNEPCQSNHSQEAPPQRDGQTPTIVLSYPSATQRPAPRWKRVGLVGLALAALDFVRYGFLMWLPTYFTSHAGVTTLSATVRSALLPLAGCLGAATFGAFHATHKPQQSKALGIGFGVGLTAACLILSANEVIPPYACLALMACVGYFLYGTRTLLAAIAPITLGGVARTSSATGIIDGIGYVGAIASGWGVGAILEVTTYNSVFACFAFTAAITTAIIACAIPQGGDR